MNDTNYNPFDTPLHTEETRTPCAFLGGKRTCCDHLHLCRKHPGDSCCPTGAGVPSDVRRCRDCSDWIPAVSTAPRRNETFSQSPWEGGWRKKSWEFPVTVAIPVLDSADSIDVIVELLRAQTSRPFIMLIDTGSVPEQLERLESMRSEDVEIHSLRLNDVRHPSDFPAIAMDLAFSACRTEWILATHADVFFRSRDVISELLELCDSTTPVVGYEITERPHSDWRGMVGHTLTMFHIPTMDRIGANWSLRRLANTRKHPDGITADHRPNPATSPNWPDTELLINYQCREAGIVPLIVGTEQNATRTIDHRIDHCRSWASAQLYSANSDYATMSENWLVDGIRQARARLAEWESES